MGITVFVSFPPKSIQVYLGTNIQSDIRRYPNLTIKHKLNKNQSQEMGHEIWDINLAIPLKGINIPRDVLILCDNPDLRLTNV